MKSVFLFCTRWYVFLTELPLVYLFVLTIDLHGQSDSLLGFYPLEIVLVFFIFFILVYFFRVIALSPDDVRMHGLFSSRERAMIRAEDTLVLTILPRHRLRVELFGSDGGVPMLEWLREEGRAPEQVNLFRAKANGGRRSVARILRFYGVPSADIPALLDAERATRDYETVTLSVERTEEKFEVRLKFLVLPE